MLSVVCFKWKKSNKGFILPTICEYGAKHVNILYNAVKRNYNKPFRFICVTDDWDGLNPEIEVVELWDKCKKLGGCYNRLFVFDKAMAKIFGDRFICIDLDCVITGDLSQVFDRTDDFIINEYPVERYKYASHQYYNGGLIMMNAGARQQVWDKFNNNLVKEINERKKNTIPPYKCELVGSDQAVIAHVLGKGEAVF